MRHIFRLISLNCTQIQPIRQYFYLFIDSRLIKLTSPPLALDVMVFGLSNYELRKILTDFFLENIKNVIFYIGRIPSENKNRPHEFFERLISTLLSITTRHNGGNRAKINIPK